MTDKQLFDDVFTDGVDAWNAWMEDHPDVGIDLTSAYFNGADLSGINLSEVCLHTANFKNSILRKSDFSYSDLSLAIFSHADLSNADLVEANLGGAKLNGANFSNANLSEADLSPHIQEVSMDDEAKMMTYNTEFIDTNLNGVNLTKAKISDTDLTRADLKNANLFNAELNNANLSGVDFRGANLRKASLINANLRGANLCGVDLREALLMQSNLNYANLSGALLDNANLNEAYLCETNLEKARLTGCHIYGISVWGVKLMGAIQSNLVITNTNEPEITVDNLKVAQSINNLLLNNKEIREVIDTITSKVVLILGRFSDERKSVLDALRDELRKRNYSPVLFDFEKPASRDFTETVSILAHMARFVIADITDAKSIPQELDHIVPQLPSVPVQPLLLASESEYGMFEHFPRYPWVLPIYRYHDLDELLNSIKEHVIAPAEEKAKELAERFAAQT